MCLVKKYCKKQLKIIDHLHYQQTFFVCMYKMLDISAETWNKTGSFCNKNTWKLWCKKLLWISDISRRWSSKNIYDLIDNKVKEKFKVEKIDKLTKQQIRKYKRDRARLIRVSKQSMYVCKVIAIPIIIQIRLSKPETIKCRSDLGFNQINLILKKE